MLDLLGLNNFLNGLLNLFFLELIVLLLSQDRLLHLTQLYLALFHSFHLEFPHCVELLSVTQQQRLVAGLLMDHAHDQVVWVVVVLPELLLKSMRLP